MYSVTWKLRIDGCMLAYRRLTLMVPADTPQGVCKGRKEDGMGQAPCCTAITAGEQREHAC